MKIKWAALGLLFFLCLSCSQSLAISVSVAGKVIDFAGDWQTVPEKGGVSYESGDSASWILSKEADYVQINAEHVQLLKGAVLVRANNKPVFVSQLWRRDKIITRVAPHAVAVVSSIEYPAVLNLSRRCCGAVITYLPSTKKEGANRFNLETGQALSFFGADAKADTDMIKDAGGASRIVDISDGAILIKSRKIDVSALQQEIFSAP